MLAVIGLGLACTQQARAEGDARVGERLFNEKCLSCHEHRPGRNALGASLVGVFGRQAGSLPGATFSRALSESNITWNEASLDEYLASPAKKLPLTLMTAHEIASAGERADIIAYLKILRP